MKLNWVIVLSLGLDWSIEKYEEDIVLRISFKFEILEELDVEFYYGFYYIKFYVLYVMLVKLIWNGRRVVYLNIKEYKLYIWSRIDYLFFY